MALLAEELVEEWLNRQGYFTIRGVKLGNHEMDLLAVRHRNGELDCRHVEVQVSINPIGYITPLTKADQKVSGKSANSPSPRAPEVFARAVDAWVEKKFAQPSKRALLQSLMPGPWARELVVNKVRFPEELELLRQRGVTILRLDEILRDLAGPSLPIARAGGGDFVELLWLGKLAAPTLPSLTAVDLPPESED